VFSVAPRSFTCVAIELRAGKAALLLLPRGSAALTGVEAFPLGAVNLIGSCVDPRALRLFVRDDRCAWVRRRA
jgi:hypothetical protein